MTVDNIALAKDGREDQFEAYEVMSFTAINGDLLKGMRRKLECLGVYWGDKEKEARAIRLSIR